MDQVNPYAAPSAQVFDAAPTAAKLSLSQMLFSFEGRIRRGQYWGHVLVVTFGYGLVLGLVMSVVKVKGLGHGESVAVGIAMVTIFALYLPMIWVAAALQAKRWHDRDKSAWWMLLTLVPLANVWAGIELGFLPGTSGRNSYGPPPG